MSQSIIPHDRLFPILAQIRLAKSFHSRADRVAAVERRLFALIAVLNGHPSQDILLGYFHAQPELCTELVDLIKPIMASSAVTSKVATTVIPHNQSTTTAVEGKASLLALADSSSIPTRVRTLAVECLTALVARRESNHGGALSGLAKLTNVFNELGIGKSQFLGFLPTLVRFSLVSLNSFLLLSENESCASDPNEWNLDDDLGLELGQIFLQASKRKTCNNTVMEEQCLEFIDAVLTLTAAVASVSSGTASLTECGIIPALLNTMTLESVRNDKQRMLFKNLNHTPYIESTLKFIVAQAIQVLEVAVAMHSNALAVFYELNGVELLVRRITAEVDNAGQFSVDSKHDKEHDTDAEMNDVSSICNTSPKLSCRKLKASKRSLLFSLFNCLTVVFHQQEHTPASNSSRSAGSHHLKDMAFVRSIMDIVQNVDCYGGVLAALTCTLVSDIINADPPVMHFVISSGIADAILFMITGRRGPPSHDHIDPRIPPSSELMLAISTVLSTFSITSDGEEKLLEHNPFRELMEIFICPTYSMPNSRCLLSDVASIVGTTFEDIIRNHSSFRPVIVGEISACLRRLVLMGTKLVKDEKFNHESADLDRSRTLFIQHAYHLSQIIEQLLSSNDETLKQFESLGGFDQILSLYPSLLPHGRRFLAHVSTHSAASLAILGQSQTIASFTATIESCTVATVNEKLISRILLHSEKYLDLLQSDIFSLRLLMNNERHITSHESVSTLRPYFSLDVTGALENVPLKPIHLLNDDSLDNALVQNLASLLRQILVVEWLTDCLAAKMKNHRRWTLDSALYGRFQEVFRRLSMLHRTSIYELCRVRTEVTYEERESRRWKKSDGKSYHPSLYKLRIVCPEGAIVRDGVEIDSSLHICALEMGEIIDAYDRCINSSGVMRYRTANGWVSEQTRGHGRELIAEVFHVDGSSNIIAPTLEENQSNRTECGVPDLVLTSGYILARLQSSYSNLCSSLARIVQGITPGSSSVDTSILHLLSESIQLSFRYFRFSPDTSPSDPNSRLIKDDGLAMYMGYMVTLLNTCLFEDRRDRIQTLNLLLLSHLLVRGGFRWGITITGCNEDLKSPDIEFFNALRFILKVGLQHLSVSVCNNETSEISPDCRMSGRRITRSVAASFPVAISTLQKLVSKCSVTEISSWSSTVKKLTDKQMREIFLLEQSLTEESTVTFDAQLFAKGIADLGGEVLSDLLGNALFRFIPAHMLHPCLSLTKNMIGYLEDYSSINPDINTASVSRPTDDSIRRRLSALSSFFGDTSSRSFQPSESAINRLVEMGFSRDLAREAIENSRSNNLEIATEWALTHLPSLPTSSSSGGSAGDFVRTDFVRDGVQPPASTFDTNHYVDDNQVSLTRDGNIPLSSNTNSAEELPSETDRKSIETHSEPNLQDRIAVLKAGVVTAAIDSIDGQLTSNNSPSSYSLSLNFDALNGVTCSFLLDFCDRYPSKRSEIVLEIIHRLISRLKCDEKGSNYQILEERSHSFASLLHSAVLLLRALPSTRALALRFNIVNAVIQCLRNYSSKSRHESVIVKYPIWLSPALLFLEIMSQPVSVELEEDNSPADDSLPKRRNDYSKVCSEHKKQRILLSKYSKRLFVGSNDKVMGSSKKKRARLKNDQNVNKDEMGETDSSNDGMEIDNSGSPFPMFLPLMTADSAELCAVACVHLLRGKQRRNSEEFTNRSGLPSDIVHAALLLLTSVSRSHRIASLLFNMGAAELLLSLPSDSRFEGHSGLLTVVYCRLLEDESTLQTAMEAEIKSTMIKLQKKSNAGIFHKPSISSSAFIEAVMPLIHRDQMVFLKSVFVSIKLEAVHSFESSDPPQYCVVLLSPEERNSRIRSVTESFKHINAVPDNIPPITSQSKCMDNQVSSPAIKLKSPLPSSMTQKNQRKEKTDPMGHVSMILLSHMIMKWENRSPSTFLNMNECVDIIADLVLSVPGFSGAVLKYHPPNTKQHESARAALRTLALPMPSTSLSSSAIIHYVLHKLLPQSDMNENGSTTNNESSIKKKKDISPEQRISQSSARLLVSLVARPGEGRWFVISELALALFDDDLATKRAPVVESNSFDQRIYAFKVRWFPTLTIHRMRKSVLTELVSFEYFYLRRRGEIYVLVSFL
jgi:hypothetical protein